jgi:glycosyltransferase involved in cell wall biosynthesis
MNQPSVTILMPAYNAEKYIRESINSLLIQTYSNFKLLIIDDGSTDQTAKIISSYNDPRIACIKNHENIGLVKTLNRGIELASTTYILRMDADDIAMPQRLEWQVDFMEKHPEVGVSGGWYRIFGNESGIPFLPEKDEDIKAALLFASLICHPTVIMRRSLFDDPGIRYGASFDFNDEFGHKILELEDFALWQKLKSKTKFANLNKVLINYRREGQNLTAKKTELIFERKKKFYTYLLNELDVVPSHMNLLLHIGLKYISSSESPGDVIAFRNYLDELRNQNIKTKVYPQQALERVIANQWQQLFYHLPSKGREYILAYKQAGKTIHRNQWMYYLKYLVNRFIGRKA